ncbi:neuromedin-U receptor 2 isoform X1 [Tenrec ecaudatus]|uniref:neuromedin-U receptor 2 isoform X1 n=1 Tax=Tenrec ecaudatus TaxID=94439 RepID=UPI003F59FA92
MEKHENGSWIQQKGLEDSLRNYLNSTEDYLTFLCGPRRSHLFLPVTVVYALIFVVGVVGNLLVCVVILRHQTMKTPTNYYLFSLAVSDLLVLLLGMPLEVYEMWHNYPFLFGPVGCYFKTALFETVCFASILSVTTVSVERYVAILHPFRAKLESTRRRALRILAVVWSFSVLFSLPNTSIHGIKFQYFPNGSLVPGSATCAVIKPLWIYNFIIQVTSFLFYILPMTVISILYYLMGLRLKKNQFLEEEEMTANIQRSTRKSVTNMLFVLVLVFAICWTPFHIDRLFFSFVEEWTESLAAVFNLIHVVSADRACGKRNHNDTYNSCYGLLGVNHGPGTVLEILVGPSFSLVREGKVNSPQPEDKQVSEERPQKPWNRKAETVCSSSSTQNRSSFLHRHQVNDNS